MKELRRVKSKRLALLALLVFSASTSLSCGAQNRNYGRAGQQAYPVPVGGQSQAGYPGAPMQLGNPYGASGQYIGTPRPSNGPYRPGFYGQYPYANQPGYGYYGANPYAGAFPALGAPVPLNGGLFRFNVGGFSGAYWRSPSGYYYPWGAGAVYTSPPPIIMVNEGSSQAAQPSVTDMLKDMSTYIEEQNTKKKFKPDDYQHLARRVKDLQSLESSMRSRSGGTLEQDDEQTLRKDCAMLSGDISRRVLP